MKVLLLSDIPPCENLTAGLVLSAMVRFLPRDSVCCFAVVNPHIDIEVSSEFANMPIVFHPKPNENWSWLPQRRILRKMSSVVSFIGEGLLQQTSLRILIDKAVSFGKEQKVDRVWAVLQGQTTIRMAKEVADRLGVPLHSHVWDPFSWWAQANKLDGINTRRTQALFDNAIRQSVAVATASEAMAEHYRDKFAVKALPVISSHHRSMGRTPNVATGVGSAVVIGMAGQFYAADEWLELIKGLTSAGWQVEGRPVKIVVLGPQKPPEATEAHVSFLGWKSQSDAAEILSQCDILYCPYPFAASMKEVAQFSFPSKLVLYLAAGRPIVFHGPDYSSPAYYIVSRDCGLIANRITSTAIFNEIERLVCDPQLYATKGMNAQAAFRNDFTLESMALAFNGFLAADMLVSNIAQTYNHSLPTGTTAYETKLSPQKRRFSLSWQIWKRTKLLRDRLVHLKRRTWSVVRFVALKTPMLKSLHHQVGALIVENRALRRQNTALGTEISRLRQMTASPQLANLGYDNRNRSSVLSQILLKDRLAGKYAHSRSLIFTQSAEIWVELTGKAAGEGADIARGRDLSGAIDQRISAAPEQYVSCLFGGRAECSTFDRNLDWPALKTAIPRNVFQSLVRATLEEACDRLVVFSKDSAASIIAIAVAELLSLPVHLIVNGDTDSNQFAWAKEHVTLEVIKIKTFDG
ncbi:glycosyltransferase [Rhizobium laguerreae]